MCEYGDMIDILNQRSRMVLFVIVDLGEPVSKVVLRKTADCVTYP